jgi:hypothetical protein
MSTTMTQDKGYHIEHNFGHLGTIFGCLAAFPELLAFFPTVADWLLNIPAVRSFSSRQTFFQTWKPSALVSLILEDVLYLCSTP